MSATEFKARSLALIDLVHEKGEVVTITKRGRVVAKPVAEVDAGERPLVSPPGPAGAMARRPVRARRQPLGIAPPT